MEVDSGLEHGRRCKVGTDLETCYRAEQVLVSEGLLGLAVVLKHLERRSLQLPDKRRLTMWLRGYKPIPYSLTWHIEFELLVGSLVHASEERRDVLFVLS